MAISKLFTYQERLNNAAQTFIKLQEAYLEIMGPDFSKIIAKDWEVAYLDLDAKVWEITNKS
jgi:hypothetical protein